MGASGCKLLFGYGTVDCVRSQKEGLLYTILHFSLDPIPNFPDKQINSYYF